jgi:hypothetical protein
VIALRKQNLSIYDISRVLETKGDKISPVSVSIILNEEGFARLPRRRDEERPPTTLKPTKGAVANVKHLDLAPRHVNTKFGGLFLFVPFLAALPFDTIWNGASHGRCAPIYSFLTSSVAELKLSLKRHKFHEHATDFFDPKRMRKERLCEG